MSVCKNHEALLLAPYKDADLLILNNYEEKEHIRIHPRRIIRRSLQTQLTLKPYHIKRVKTITIICIKNRILNQCWQLAPNFLDLASIMPVLG